MEQKFEPLKGLQKLHIKEIRLDSSNKSVRLDETVDLTVKFSVAGGARDIFNQETWHKAYDAWDKLFRMTYHVGIKNLIKPQKFVRRASFYWTRDPDLNPDYSKKIWAMIVLEGREPIIPKNEEYAKRALFDVEKTFHVLGSDIGKGKHKLRAYARASWGRHIFGEKGSDKKVSDPIEIECR